MVHPGRFSGKNLSKPRGAQQIPPLRSGRQGEWAAQVGVVSGMERPAVYFSRGVPGPLKANLGQSVMDYTASPGLTGCGKSRFTVRSQPSAAKAALIQQL